MEKATNYLFQFGNSKEEMLSFVERVQQEVIDGLVDPIKFHALINTLVKGLSEALKANTGNIDIVGEHKAYGYTLKPKESGVKYDFSNCGHPAWVTLNQQSEAAKKQMKEIETMLKSLTKPTTMIEDETGEVYTVNPPVKKSTSIIEVR